MWEKQNAYNNPASQMQRFKDAGLNPNLMFSQGESGNASEMPKYNQTGTDFSKRQNSLANILGAISQFQDIKMKGSQIDLVDENRKGVEAENILKNLRNAYHIKQGKIFLPVRNRKTGEMTELRMRSGKMYNLLKSLEISQKQSGILSNTGQFQNQMRDQQLKGYQIKAYKALQAKRS